MCEDANSFKYKLYNLEDLRGKVEQLGKQSLVAHYDLGFLRATIDNPEVGQKISSSYSGHALDIAIRAVFKSSVMYVTRSWDTSLIPSICFSMRKHSKQIEDERLKQHPDFPTTFLEIGQVESKLDAMSSKISTFLGSEPFLSIRVYRDEHHAHLYEGSSRTRKRIETAGGIPGSPTFRSILSAGLETAEIVAELSRTLIFSVDDYNGRIDIAERNSRQFWSVLPPLSLLEARQK